ncbi:MAG: PAS domain S-box protein [Desulfobacula sp.]|nr:PAS domain S-box protein [Desulfobacula sp.]
MVKKPFDNELEQIKSQLKRCKEQLAHSFDLTDYILSNARSAIAVYDKDLRYIYASKRYLKDYKITKQNVAGKHHYDIFPDIPEKWKEVHQRALAGEVITAEEDPYLREDGFVNWTRWECRPWYEYDGSIGGIVIYNEVINERREIEEALKKSEQLLSTHLLNTPIGAISWDLNFNTTEWNPAAQTIFGYTKKEAMGKHILQLILPKDLREFGDDLLQDLLSEKGGGHSINENLTKDGRRITCEWYNTALKDADGKAIGMASLVNDITKRIHTEKALKKSEEKYRTILESIEEAYYEVDIAGNLTFFNSSLCKILGYSKDELMGMNNRQYLDAKNAKIVYTAFNSVYKTKKSYKAFDWELVKKNGSICYVETTLSIKVDSKGRTIGFQGVITDITEQKKIKAQLLQAQKMESVGRLAGGVAHDYNNALSVIMGYTELAMTEVEDPTGRLQADLNQVLKAGRRATDITRQLLAFARKQTIAPLSLDLNENVETMLKMLRRLIGEDIDLAWLPGKNLWPVKMDPSQIDQILANLCVNARDAIEGVGKITIQTGTRILDTSFCADHTGFVPGKFVLLAIRDNGCGMDKEILNNIFEPFFTTKAIDKGTGLGLATVYGIVQQNKGFINVESEFGKGTTVNIYLPRHKSKAVEVQEEISKKIPQARGETILLVEDDLPILKLTEKILKGLGYEVLVANTPKKAIKIAREHKGNVHLLVTDVIMPEMNGLELSKQLKPFYSEIKCMFMSGYTADAIEHHGVLDEGTHFLKKPFSSKELAIIVRKAIGDG